MCLNRRSIHFSLIHEKLLVGWNGYRIEKTGQIAIFLEHEVTSWEKADGVTNIVFDW